MKLRRPLLLVAFMLLCFYKSSVSQPYNTGIGFRLGGITRGITLKHYIGSNSALEGILSFGRHSFLITGLYERHHDFPNAQGLSWFYGGGAHIGFISGDYNYYYFYHHKKHKDVIYIYDDDYNDYDSKVYIGADFIIGMEYKFNNTPIALGLDVKPFVDFVPVVQGYWEGAFTFRFTF